MGGRSDLPLTVMGVAYLVVVYEAERDAPEATVTTLGDAQWWVLTTITTVGYGDRYPVSVVGRLLDVVPRADRGAGRRGRGGRLDRIERGVETPPSRSTSG